MEKAIMNRINYETAIQNKNIGKIFVIAGKAASGKTAIIKDIEGFCGLKRIITNTTRPPRNGEIDGKDYNFIEYGDFNDENFVAVEHLDTAYGKTKYGVRKTDVGAMENYVVVTSPSGYYDLRRVFGSRVIGIYLMSSIEQRFERYMNRDIITDLVVKEAQRRFIADEEDFFGLEYEIEHIVINNKEYSHMLEIIDDIILRELILE